MMSKIELMKEQLKLLELEGTDESETITLPYINYLKRKIKLMEEAYEYGKNEKI